MSTADFLLGVKVFVNELAINYRCWHTVERLPGRKRRRKAYRVRKNEERKPGAFKLADGSLMLHPAIYAQMKNQLRPHP